jgi:Tol biopolymer transport system component
MEGGPMLDDQIRSLLRTLEDDRAPDPAFADALYRRLNLAAGDRRRSRAPFVLLAAAVLTILAAGFALGSGRLRLPEIVEASGSPRPSMSGMAVASPSATAPGTEGPAPSGSAQPDPAMRAGSILFAEADRLRIRSEPSDSGEIQATIRRGQLMATTGRSQTVADMDWYEVRIGPGGPEGWVAAGPDDGWLRLVQDGAVTVACSGCGETPSVVSVTPFGDANITTIGSAEELVEWAWSPDGTRLVASRGGTTLPSRIVLLDGAGSELADLGIGVAPAWSPDGARLSWLGEDGLVATDDALAPTTVDLGGLSGGAPSWSPDGTRFALIAVDDPGAIDAPGSVYVVPVGSGEPVRLTEPGYVNGITWSPDGSTLGFATVDPSGESPSRAFIVAAEGGEPQALLDGGAVLFPPMWSPGGDAIALVTPDGLALAAGDGTGQTILVPTQSEEFLGEVSWSPSGSWLLYSLSTGREPTLWIVPVDGSAPPAPISPDGAGAQQADWQPVLVPLR